MKRLFGFALAGALSACCFSMPSPPPPPPPPEDGGTSGGAGGGFVWDGGGPAPLQTATYTGDDFCAFLTTVQANTTYLIEGNHDTPWRTDFRSGAIPGDGNAAVGGDHICVPNNLPDNVTLRAAPGWNPLVMTGGILLFGANGWVFDNIDFTNDEPNFAATSLAGNGLDPATSARRMGGLLKLIGGDGWRIENSEIFYAWQPNVGDFGGVALGITGPGPGGKTGTPINWVVRNNWFHDNPGCIESRFDADAGATWCNAGNGADTVHNHLIYMIGDPMVFQNGLIENNLIANSPWGFLLKLGGSGSYNNSQGVRGVVVRNNTFIADDTKANPRYTSQPAIFIDDDSSLIELHDNVFHDVAWPGQTARDGIWSFGTPYQVGGVAFWAHRNVTNTQTTWISLDVRGTCGGRAIDLSQPQPQALLTYGVLLGGFQCAAGQRNGFMFGVAPDGGSFPIRLEPTLFQGITYTPGSCARYGPPDGGQLVVGGQRAGADFSKLSCPPGS